MLLLTLDPNIFGSTTAEPFVLGTRIRMLLITLDPTIGAGSTTAEPKYCSRSNLATYNKVFVFLAGVKRALWSLQAVRQDITHQATSFLYIFYPVFWIRISVRIQHGKKIKPSFIIIFIVPSSQDKGNFCKVKYRFKKSKNL